MLFQTSWNEGSVNDCIIAYCKRHNIKFQYNHYFQMEIYLYNRWIKTDYEYDKENDILTIFEKE